MTEKFAPTEVKISTWSYKQSFSDYFKLREKTRELHTDPLRIVAFDAESGLDLPRELKRFVQTKFGNNEFAAHTAVFEENDVYIMGNIIAISRLYRRTIHIRFDEGKVFCGIRGGTNSQDMKEVHNPQIFEKSFSLMIVTLPRKRSNHVVYSGEPVPLIK